MENNTIGEKNKKLHYGFVMVAALFVMQAAGCLIMGVASIFYTPISEEFGIPISTYALNMTILMFTMVAILPLLARVCKKFDMRYVMAAALLLEALAYAMRAMATNMWMIYISAVMLAPCMAILFLLSIPLLMNSWFPFNTGTMLGIVGAAQGLAGLLLNSLGGLIIQNYGWRACFWAWVILCLALTPVALFFIRSTPAAKGLEPYGIEKAKLDGVSSAANVEESGVDAKTAFRSLPFLLIMIAMPLSCFVSTYHFYLNSYFRTIGFSIAVAGVITGVLQGGNMLFKLVIGRICDKSVRAGGIFYVVCTIICFILLLSGATGAVPMAIAALLFGNIYAATNLYGPSITKNAFGIKDLAKLWATVSMGIQLIGGFGATIWGIIVERTSYQTSFVIAIVLCVIILILFNAAITASAKMKDK